MVQTAVTNVEKSLTPDFNQKRKNEVWFLVKSKCSQICDLPTNLIV